MSNITNNKRIAKNTLMLYFRQLLILGVSLYTVRVVLDVLGVEDYGIYNVVAGIVSFFSFLSGTMASASQRFFSFAIGEKNDLKLKETFSVNCVIYIIIAVIAFILLESVGLWFVNNKLNIDPDSLHAASIVFQFSIFTFVTTILATPFMAVIIAHEDMQIYAYVSILEAIMKLAVVFLLNYISINKLELYGSLVFFVSVINFLVYLVISLRKYEECQFRKVYWRKELMMETVRFTGWTLFGQITTVLRNQAVTILLNQVFTPIVVAARAIAMSVSSQVGVFSNNFNVGLYPPIIKSYASKDTANLYLLIFNGSKITFFLMWVIAFPMFMEMDYILNIWLKNPPESAVLFSRLSLIEILISSISLPITTAARAPGKMKQYELTLGSIQISIFFASWLVLFLGYPAYSVFVVAIIANVLMMIVRLLLVSKLIGISFSGFIKNVVVPVTIMLSITVIFVIPVYYISYSGFFFMCLRVIYTIIISLITMYFIVLKKNEREKIMDIVINYKNKIKLFS